MENTTQSESDKQNRGQVAASISRNEYILKLKERIQNLKELCQNLDPYVEISQSVKEQLLSVGIESYDNPFNITNQLLMMTENSIEELLNLEQKPENNKE